MITEEAKNKQEIEDRIACVVHAAGFKRVSVEDRPVPFADPSLRKPTWSKYVYGTLWTFGPFKMFGQALIEAARKVDGCLVEWCVLGGHGWQALSCDDMDTLVVEMPVRASFQSLASTEDIEYDEAKVLAARWLESGRSIDFRAVATALMSIGFTVSAVDFTVNEAAGDARLVATDTRERDSIKVLTDWAASSWVWPFGGYISVKDHTGEWFKDVDCIAILRGASGALQVEVYDEAPF